MPDKMWFSVGPADTRKDNFPVKNCDNNFWYFTKRTKQNRYNYYTILFSCK